MIWLRNRFARRNRRGAAPPPHGAGLHVIDAVEAAAADAALRAAAPGPHDLLVVDGGDGSVQRALSVLVADGAAAGTLPALALLPSGSTNMTASSVSGRVGRWRALQALERSLLQPGHAFLRRIEAVLVVDDAGQRRAGFFVGAGLVVDGIRYWQERIRARGAADEWTTAVAAIRAIAGVVRGEARFAQAPTVAIDGGAPRALRMLLATTLERLLLGARPFQGGGNGPLRLTTVDASPGSVAAALPVLLRGRAPDAASGCTSRRVHAVDFAFHGVYTIDGELFDCGNALRLAAFGPLRCLLLR